MTTSHPTTSRVSRVVTALLVGALVVLALVYRVPLVAWFTGKSMGDAVGTQTATHAGAFRLKAALDPDPPTTRGNTLVLEVRDGSDKLIDDASVAIAYEMPAMGSMAEMKGTANVEHEERGRYRAHFDLPTAGTFRIRASVRAASGSAAQDYSLTVGSKGLSAPSGSTAQTESAAMTSHASNGEIDHYTCSMHPSVNQPGPGKCPICGMDLIPVTKQQQTEGVVMIDERRRQLIGVRTAPVVAGPMRRSFRAVGRIAYDESSFTDVNLKVSGWVTKLLVSQTGQRVERGQTLFMLYSPELYNAQQDFLLATRSAHVGAPPGDGSPTGAEQFGRAARKRLSLLGLSDAQIDKITASGEPLDTLPIASPASGFVIEKDIVEGASVQASMRLFRIAALDKVWVEADVYEDDLAHVRVGQAAKITLDYLPGQTYEAKVAYVYPYLESAARTGRVRIKLENKKLELRPGMYAQVELSTPSGSQLQLPASAVVYTGPRRLVFVDLGDGRFKPQEVRVGTETNGMFEVFEGLKAGDVVATSGTFLIAAEARISTAAKYWDNSAPVADASMAPVIERPAQQTMDDHAMPLKRTPGPVRTQHRAVPADAPASSAAPMQHELMPTAAPESSVYSCPMHPEVRSPVPGKCPKCGMTLVLVPERKVP
jgi:multidrug efflux pump subunit AcrA (membrane-fusion protein)